MIEFASEIGWWSDTHLCGLPAPAANCCFLKLHPTTVNAFCMNLLEAQIFFAKCDSLSLNICCIFDIFNVTYFETIYAFIQGAYKQIKYLP